MTFPLTAYIEAALETDLENDAGVACRADGSIGVGQFIGDRFFAEDCLAGLGGGDDRIGVVRGGCGDHHRFDGGISQQLLVVRGPEGTAEGRRATFSHSGHGVGQSDESDAKEALGEAGRVVRADQADADDACTNRFFNHISHERV